MTLFWILYWSIMLASIGIGLLYMIKCKKRKWIGLFQIVETIVLVVSSFLFAFSRDFATQNEFEHLFDEAYKWNNNAIMIILLYLLFIYIFIRNIWKIKKETRCL